MRALNKLWRRLSERPAGQGDRGIHPALEVVDAEHGAALVEAATVMSRWTPRTSCSSTGSGLHAMQGICSHEYFELDKGFLTGDSITCALHLSRFDLETGEASTRPPSSRCGSIR